MTILGDCAVLDYDTPSNGSKLEKAKLSPHSVVMHREERCWPIIGDIPE